MMLQRVFQKRSFSLCFQFRILGGTQHIYEYIADDILGQGFTLYFHICRSPAVSLVFPGHSDLIDDPADRYQQRLFRINGLQGGNDPLAALVGSGNDLAFTY